MKYKAFDHGVNIITLEKNHQKMAMTCAWAMQVDYDKILCLLGSQSVTGNTIKKGDYIGISVLGISQKEIAEATVIVIVMRWINLQLIILKII